MNNFLSFYIVICIFINSVYTTNTTTTHNDEPSSVVVLSDSTFEKLTQATTGSTTGPWFVKFYAPWCSHCRKMGPAWEKLAKDLKGYVNVADVDVTKNAQLGKRFNIRGYPTLLFIHEGKMYTYEGGERTTERLATFATGGYKNSRSVPVPAPLSLLGHLTDFVVSGVHESQRIYDAAFRGFVTISSFSFLFGLVLGLILSVVLLTRNTVAYKPARFADRKKD